MATFYKYLIILVFYLVFVDHTIATSHANERELPSDSVRSPNKRDFTVVIVLLIRNKAHTLPFFLNYLQNLNYPKNRITLWIRCDHSSDRSDEIINAWLLHVRHLYHAVNVEIDNTTNEFSDQEGDCHWSEERFKNVIKLRQQALDFGREAWSDYIFYVDVDVMLLNDYVLRDLMLRDKTLISPMLNSTASEWYSNFWAGMEDNGYYKRTPEYEPILRRHWEGCFQVANIHTAFLINLRHVDSTHLAFWPPPPDYSTSNDDVIIFAHSAMHHEIPMHLLNTDFYGFLNLPMQDHNTLEHEIEQFTHMKVEAITYTEPLQRLPYVELPAVTKDTLGFDQVYMVNLLRRPDRRQKMLSVFEELGIESKIVDAVDGKMLNDTYLEKLGIKMLKGYADPYHGRALTMGEIGCFLSHHYIWTDMIDNNYTQVAVFEDDLRFEPYFRIKLNRVMTELSEHNVDWDLVYLGRKRLNAKDETWLSESLVLPHYSYWTLSYLLSRSGATKLLNQRPLQKLIPVDEYLPVMFDRHFEDEWKKAFSPRDLVALSVQPLLIYPTHYTGEPGYITDTEDSNVIDSSVGNHGDKEAKHRVQPPNVDIARGNKRGDMGSNMDKDEL